MEKTLNPFLAKWLWSERYSDYPAWKKHLITIARYLYVLIDDLASGQLTMRAMSLVYTSLLSIVPLMAVSFSVLKAFGMHNKQLEPILLQFMEPMGDKGVEITAQIISFIDNVKISILGVVGIALLMYTAISLIQKIESTFNYLWRLQQNRSIGRRFTDYGSVMLIGPLLVFSAIGVSASILGGAFVKEASQFEVVAWGVQLLTKSLPYLMIIGAFTFFYIFIPNTKVKLHAGLIAGAVSGVLWQTVGWAFGSFVVKATDSSTYAIYSGFAILILFMLWMYISWMILLIGGSLAFYTQHPEYVVPTRREGGMSAQQQERLALQIMSIVTLRQYESKNPVSAEYFVRRLGSQIQGIQMVLTALVGAGLLKETNDEVTCYLPKVAMDETPIRTVLNAVRSANAMPPLHHRVGRKVAGVAAVEQRVGEAIDQALDGLTVKDMALKLDLETDQPVRIAHDNAAE